MQRASKYEMEHWRRKCNIKIEDVIKVENATSMCNIQYKEKYKRSKKQGYKI